MNVKNNWYGFEFVWIYFFLTFSSLNIIGFFLHNESRGFHMEKYGTNTHTNDEQKTNTQTYLHENQKRMQIKPKC